MGTTARGVVYPDDSSPIDGIQDDMEALAESVDVALDDAVDALPFRTAAGEVVVSLSASNVGFSPITFPVGRFTVPPLLLATIKTAPGGSQKFVVRALNTTVTDAAIYVYTGDASSATGSVSVAWFAVQMTPASAAG